MSIEQEFFKIFEIAPVYKNRCKAYSCTKFCKHYKEGECDNSNLFVYPKLTANILLDLICLLSQYDGTLAYLHCKDKDELKDFVLQECIRIKKDIYGQFKDLEHYENGFKVLVNSLFIQEKD